MFDSIKNTLTTERLILRPIEPTDAQNVSQICNNFNVYKGTLSLPYPYPIDCAVNWLESIKHNFKNDIGYQFAITDKNTGLFYGSISLSYYERHKNGELGYWLGEDYWNKGYTTEAVKAVIWFAFNIKKYHKVYASHFESNPASGKVMIKAGMLQEGFLIDHVQKDNKYQNLVCYGILNP